MVTDAMKLSNERNKLKQRLEGVDRAIARIERWHGRLLLGRDDIVKQTLDTVFRIFDDEVGKEVEEFSEATIQAIREREEERQRKILEEAEG